MATCPACQNPTLKTTGFEVNLNDVLSRWEKHMGNDFEKEVWSHYQSSINESLTQFRCGFCGFSLFDPIIEGTKTFYKTITADDYYVSDKWEHLQAIKDLRRRAAKRVIDIGCGSSLFLKLLRKEEPHIYLLGQEIYESCVDDDLFNVEKFIGGVGEIIKKTPDIKRFDAVTMFQVLEHAPDPWALLESCSELLRPGGTLIVSTPDGGGPITRFKDALTEIPPHHLTQWTETAYRSSLPRFGFDVVRVRREPLPNYLWDSYLPVLWDKDIWPSQFLDSFFKESDRSNNKLGLSAQILHEAGITHLHGVPGHTIYIVARKNYDR